MSTWPASWVISGSSGAAATDVNAALPVPELHPAAKADVTTTDTAEIITPNYRPLRWLMLGRFLLTGSD
jgi:hypothetical protein